MILSTNFLKDYIDLDENIDVTKLAEDMTRVGNEYDSAEKLVPATNLVIGEIIECEPHPDSDHLHLCKVNIGSEVLNIVCGAPNARKGIKVIVAKVGAELPEITIKKGNTCEYYYCSSYLRNKECSKHTVVKKKLEDAVLKTINNQIKLLLNIDMKIDEIIKDEGINYDIEILNNRIEELDDNIDKYDKLKESIKEDFENDIITKEEYVEYKNDYNLFLKKFRQDKEETNKKIEEICFKSEKNKEWIDEFKKNENITHLTKKVIDELVDDIFIYEDGNINIKFKYQDEYLEAIDFIKKHNCDIM